MDDVRDRLRRASELVAPPDRSFDRMLERRDRNRQRQRLASAAMALAIGAAAVGGGVTLLSQLGRDPHDAVGTGWQPTRRLALRPGEYFYLRVTSDRAIDGHLRDLETWWASDGSGEVRNRSTRQDKYPYPPSGAYGEDEFPESYDVSSLATDPEVLESQLRDGTFEGHIALLLETPYASPELRAAVFDVASGIEGVTLIEDVHDPAGRPAIALETSERDGNDIATWRTYFDPGTHQALAWAFETTRGGSAWILLESAIVGAPGERPDPDEWLVPPIHEQAT
jgi:hypothetical protein